MQQAFDQQSLICSSKSVYDPSMRQDPLDSEFESVIDKDLYDISERGNEYSDGIEESDFLIE